MKFIIRISYYRFKCPLCGTLVSKGCNYADNDGLKTCVPCAMNEQES